MNRSLLHTIWRWLYGAYALSAFAALIVVAAILALVVPRLGWRRALTRNVARLWLWVARIRLSVHGIDQLPAGSCVLVANHSSYLDGVVMKAALPPRFSFVIKREAASMPVLGVLLRRIGSEFVDRHTQGGRHRDAKRVVRRAEAGHSLVFFPEGTFDEHVGLKRFHIGAFVAAARGGAPVVPAVIHGTRRAMPGGSIAPRPGRVIVDILTPLEMPASGGSAEWLRDEARRLILAQLDEPDLAPVQSARTR